VEINEEFDEDGDWIEATYTFGNENIANQYRKMQYDAIQDVQDMLNGKKPIPYSVLPKAIREATNIINAGDTTQFYYRADGIYGYNTDNKNWVVRMNANGLGYSTDGGQTYSNAITHLGVVTEALIAGKIDANMIVIYGSEGYNQIQINGDRMKVWDRRDFEVYTEISKGRIHANKGALSITRDDAYTDSNGNRFGFYMENGIPKINFDVQRNQFMHSGVVTHTGQRYQMSGSDMVDGQTYNLETLHVVHKSKNIGVDFNMGLSGISSAYVLVELAEVGGGVVATHRKFVSDSDGYVWGRINHSLGVPNYTDGKGYYIRAGLESRTNNAYLQVFVSRVSMYG